MSMDIEIRPGSAPSDATTPPPLPPPPPESGPAATPRRRPPRMLVVAALATSAVILAGVAGVTVATRRPPSPGAYAAKADAVCVKTNGTAASIPTVSSYPQLTSAAGTLAATVHEQLAALRTLERPAGAAGLQAAVFLDAMGAGAQAAEALRNSPGPATDVATVRDTKLLQSRFAEAGEKATALGLSACAVGLRPGVEAVANGSRAVVKVAFVAKAEALCRGAARELDGIEPADNTPREVGRAYDRAVQVFTRLWRDVDALPVPPGDEAEVRARSDANAQQLQKLRELRDALTRADVPRAVAAAEALDVAVTNADAKLDSYGLKVCGSNFGTR
ncbi:MAG: hypothetical protein ACRD12_05990 [Acidimicrobiales bacterium]